MPKRIRIIATSTYEYVPDFHSDFCVEHGITDLPGALAQDRSDLLDEKILPIDIAGEPIIITYQLDIINDN